MNERTIKICLLIFNIACLFIGLATLVIGILTYSLPVIQQALQYVTSNVSGAQISILSILMMAIGGFITFISIVGCCGAMNESKCMIGVYCIILLLLFVGQLSVGILGFVYRDQILEFSSRYDELIRNKNSIVTTIEETFNCCGYNGPQDYDARYNRSEESTLSTNATISSPTNAATPSINATISSTTNAATPVPVVSTTAAPDRYLTTMNNLTTSAPKNVTTSQVTSSVMLGKVSESCCKKNATGMINKQMCLDPTRTDFQMYVKTNGCKDEVIAFIKRYELIIGAVAVAFAAIELLSLIAGCSFFKTLD